MPSDRIHAALRGQFISIHVGLNLGPFVVLVSFNDEDGILSEPGFLEWGQIWGFEMT